MAPTALSIVIPALDEEREIARAVAAALPEADEVVVCDGGSGDRTVELARAAGARVVASRRGRGRQLNRGAESARGGLLLFLHADTRLPEGGGERVRRALASGHPGGGFEVRWDSQRPVYRLGERLVNLRTRLTRAPLGDQAQFCSRDAFRELGGFRDWPVLEDLDFVRRLAGLGRPAVLHPPVTTSARRFESLGIARALAVNWTIFTLYLLGVPPERLGRLYRRG